MQKAIYSKPSRMIALGWLLVVSHVRSHPVDVRFLSPRRGRIPENAMLSLCHLWKNGRPWAILKKKAVCIFNWETLDLVMLKEAFISHLIIIKNFGVSGMNIKKINDKVNGTSGTNIRISKAPPSTMLMPSTYKQTTGTAIYNFFSETAFLTQRFIDNFHMYSIKQH